jgi:hypothetical protein
MVKTLWLASLSIISGLIPVPATATATTTAASASVLVRSTARDGCCCDREITTRARWNVQRRGLCPCVDRRLLSGLSRRHTLAFQDQDGAARCLSSVSCVMGHAVLSLAFSGPCPLRLRIQPWVHDPTKAACCFPLSFFSALPDAWYYGPVHFPIPTQNISSSTHHIKSFDACMEH